MNFFELVKNRQSCRAYDKNKKVAKEDIEKILEAAMLAPSARNRQPWKFYVTMDSPLKDEVARACQENGANAWLSDCPCIITVVKEPQPPMPPLDVPVKRQDFRGYDIGLSIANLTLAAKELGLDTLIVGYLNDKKIINVLELPEDTDIALVIAVGYAPEGYELRPKNRKQFSDCVIFK
jgi:nitroreductase